MSNEQVELTGPDFTLGFPLSTLANGAMLAGHAAGKPVLVARVGDEIFVSATSTIRQSVVAALCSSHDHVLASGHRHGEGGYLRPGIH